MPPSCPRIRLLITALLLALPALASLRAQDPNIIKAAYLRNALNFADWPNGTFPSRNSPFILGLAGQEDELETSLRLAFGQLNFRIQNRAVQIRVFKNAGGLAEAVGKEGVRACQALFIPATFKADYPFWIKAAGNHPILLISDDASFTDQGGALSLLPSPKQKGRFIYNIQLKHLRVRRLRFNKEFLRIRSSIKVISK